MDNLDAQYNQLKQFIRNNDDALEYLMQGLDPEKMFEWMGERAKIQRKEFLEQTIPKYQAELAELKAVK